MAVLYQTWPAFAYTILLMQSSFHSRKEIKAFWKKIREDVVGGPSIVLTRKAVVDETSIRKSTNLFKSIVGIDASQLYPYWMYQTMRQVFICVGSSIQKRVESYLDKTGHAALTIWSCLISNEEDQNVKLEASLQHASLQLLYSFRKLIASVLMGFFLIATLCLKPWVAFTTSAPAKSSVFSH